MNTIKIHNLNRTLPLIIDVLQEVPVLKLKGVDESFKAVGLALGHDSKNKIVFTVESIPYLAHFNTPAYEILRAHVMNTSVMLTQMTSNIAFEIDKSLVEYVEFVNVWDFDLVAFLRPTLAACVAVPSAPFERQDPMSTEELTIDDFLPILASNPSNCRAGYNGGAFVHESILMPWDEVDLENVHLVERVSPKTSHSLAQRQPQHVTFMEMIQQIGKMDVYVDHIIHQALSVEPQENLLDKLK